jgi:hypothetical protein
MVRLNRRLVKKLAFGSLTENLPLLSLLYDPGLTSCRHGHTKFGMVSILKSVVSPLQAKMKMRSIIY